MYALLFTSLAGLGLFLLWRGFSGRRKGLVAAGAMVGAGTLVFAWFLGFWIDKLWFDSLGQAGRFWRAFGARVGIAVLGASIGLLATFGLLASLRRHGRRFVAVPMALAAVIGAAWGAAHWDTALLFMNRVEAGIREPILDRDVGFYLFALPWYDAMQNLLLGLAALCLVSALAYPAAAQIRAGGGLPDPFRDGAGSAGASLLPGPGTGRRREESLPALHASAAAAFFALAWGQYLGRFHLLNSDFGVVHGPGWTDAHIRLPAHAALAVAAGVLGLAFLVLPGLPPARRAGGRSKPWTSGTGLLGTAGGTFAALWMAGMALIPALFQWLRVQPNEITLERPYLAENIRFTRQAFGLDRAEVREIASLDTLTREIVENNRGILDNVRLWDPRALMAVYKQFQEIRLYYEFTDVDIDRYKIGDEYLQVMVSPREMDPSLLPEQAQTFVNRRFKYTHGFGITLAPVSEFTREGLPNLLIRDIPPRSAAPSLEVTQPRIYYGEIDAGYVIADSREAEFDYPSHDGNVYYHYEGPGGVVISGLWRKFLFGWRFDGTRLLLSSYPDAGSRILYRRNIRDRIGTLVPFLRLDSDPYIVLSEGRLLWIQDCYSVSDAYPYSEPFDSRERIGEIEGSAAGSIAGNAAPALHGANYLRNSVKAVMDAFTGAVDLYVFEPEDPVIRAWSGAFPGLFKPREAMPADLERHIRYPEDQLLAQGMVYSKYHMTDPVVFYNQEDLWRRATEKYHDRVIPVDPYYVMWRPSGMDSAEFTLILPFTPKDRQVLIGWIAGLCDPGNYGRFVAYQFPKETRIIGPQQVETKIDQDPILSERLTLWDQKGSRVIRGNVLAIPIDGSLLYVEPIYIQADAAAYPELRLVAVMHMDRFGYAETFEEALDLILGDREAPVAAAGGVPPAPPSPGRRIREANRAFEEYLRALGEERFDASARALEDLRSALGALMADTSAGTDAQPPRAEAMPGTGLAPESRGDGETAP